MGHTEDAYPECSGRTYIVQAEVLDEKGDVIEEFSSLAYPGFLPGYTMGFNKHGMMHSVNTINPAKRNPNGTRMMMRIFSFLKSTLIIGMLNGYPDN